ncbi:MAG: permease-like cell division protein FtsX [Gammaproteobacteria bacterium]
MIAWLTRHLQTLVGSLGRLSQQKFSTFLTMLVIGIALALPTCLHVLVTNAQRATGAWHRALEISVFLQPQTPETEAQQLADRISKRRDVAQVELITAAKGLEEFQRQSGFGEALAALNENPLPHALLVRPDGAYTSTDHLAELAAWIRELPSVDIVQLDTGWVERLNAILEAISRAIVIATALLALGVLVIVGNTIRLDIQNRRAEIEITKLVGGSDGFVRRPFLYSGLWYGLGGAVLAWLITALVVSALRDPVGRIASLYGSSFELASLDLGTSTKLLLTGAALGWIGSFLSATRHLRDIEPS